MTAMEWTPEAIEEAAEVLTRKCALLLECNPGAPLADVVGTVVVDMALLSEGSVTLADYRPAE